MSPTEIILTSAGLIITTMLSVIGYLVVRQFTKLDKFDTDFLETKSKMLELSQHSRLDKRALIEHLENEILPKLNHKKLEDQVADLRSQIITMKEYQRNKIEPAITNATLAYKKLDVIEKKQKDSDDMLLKMFGAVKILVEKKNNQ